MILATAMLVGLSDVVIELDLNKGFVVFFYTKDRLDKYYGVFLDENDGFAYALCGDRCPRCDVRFYSGQKERKVWVEDCPIILWIFRMETGIPSSHARMSD